MTHATDYFAKSLISSIERIIACLDGLDAEGMNWKPTAEGTNSLYVLAVHTMANAEEVVVSLLGGVDIPRVRASEFVATGESADWVHNRWADLKPRIEQTLAGISTAELDREFPHARRPPMTGWQALVQTSTHAAEHVGHAEMTRDLLKAQ